MVGIMKPHSGASGKMFTKKTTAKTLYLSASTPLVLSLEPNTYDSCLVVI